MTKPLESEHGAAVPPGDRTDVATSHRGSGGLHRLAIYARTQTRAAWEQQRGADASWRITDRAGRDLAALALPVAAAEGVALTFQASLLHVGVLQPGPGFARAPGQPLWMWAALIGFQGLFTAAVTVSIAMGVLLGAHRRAGTPISGRRAYRAVAARTPLLGGAIATMWALEVVMGAVWLFAYRTSPGISPWWFAVGLGVAVAVPLIASGHAVWPRALVSQVSYRKAHSRVAHGGVTGLYRSGVGVALSSPVGFFPLWLAVIWFAGGLSVRGIPSGLQPLGDITVTAIIVLGAAFVARYLVLHLDDTPIALADQPTRPRPDGSPTHPSAVVGWLIVAACLVLPALALWATL